MKRDPKISKATIERDGHCQRCKTEDDLICHHIEAIIFGGPDTLDNTVTLCGTCHHGWHKRCEGWVTFDQFMSNTDKPETRSFRTAQREGIEAAKAKGVYRGRKASIDRDQIVELVNAGVPKAEIARRLGIAKSSVFRVIDEMKAS